MSSNRGTTIRCALAALLGSMWINAAHAAIGCPPTHDGKPLENVDLFEGPPSDKAAQVPEPGRFIVPQRPRRWSGTFPTYTLGCTYRGSDAVVTVVLPRGVRVCNFTNGPQVRCH
jgi:hypothetical protein